MSSHSFSLSLPFITFMRAEIQLQASPSSVPGLVLVTARLHSPLCPNTKIKSQHETKQTSSSLIRKP